MRDRYCNSISWLIDVGGLPQLIMCCGEIIHSAYVAVARRVRISYQA